MRPEGILLIGLATLLGGCASSNVARLGTDVVAAGAGGVVANKLSNGNPYWTLGGGVAALGLAEWARSATESDKAKELALAFDRGKAQNAQATYDAIQQVQERGRRETAANLSYTEIPITAPERTINGVKINASTEFVRISTP